MRIGYDKRAAATDAFALLVEGWNEQVQRGFTVEGDAICPISTTDQVVYAESDEQDIIGAISFQADKDTGVASVKVAYVEPSSRKRGVFKQLLAEMHRIAMQQGMDRVVVTASPDNAEFLAVMRHLNRPVVAHTFELGV